MHSCRPANSPNVAITARFVVHVTSALNELVAELLVAQLLNCAFSELEISYIQSSLCFNPLRFMT